MGLRDDEFPGRHDKLIWVFVLFAFAPVGPSGSSGRIASLTIERAAMDVFPALIRHSAGRNSYGSGRHGITVLMGMKARIGKRPGYVYN